jgi:hypothetical protein
MEAGFSQLNVLSSSCRYIGGALPLSDRMTRVMNVMICGCTGVTLLI